MLHIKTKWHVAVFTFVITLFAMVASVIYDRTMLPSDDFERNLLGRVIFAGSLGFFVAVVVGHRMLGEYKLKQSLQYALEYDALTGTHSRSAILSRVKRAGRRPGVLVIADIDHFKRINDTWGHAAGDEVLRHFGKRSRGFLDETFGRDKAAIGRIGGEEFLIHVDGVDIDHLPKWIEGLRQVIRDGPPVDGSAQLTVTASYGVALLDGKQDIDSVLVDADAALYRAKESGRDRACVSKHFDLHKNKGLVDAMSA